MPPYKHESTNEHHACSHVHEGGSKLKKNLLDDVKEKAQPLSMDELAFDTKLHFCLNGTLYFLSAFTSSQLVPL